MKTLIVTVLAKRSKIRANADVRQLRHFHEKYKQLMKNLDLNYLIIWFQLFWDQIGLMPNNRKWPINFQKESKLTNGNDLKQIRSVNSDEGISNKI